MTRLIKELEPIEDFSDLRGKKLKFFLFGEKISKSMAPAFHKFVYNDLGLDWTYELCETSDRAKFKSVLRSNNCIGSAITMPNKIAFIDEVDMLDEVGKGVGSINTIYTRKNIHGDVLRIGTNTDTLGVYMALNEKGSSRDHISKSAGGPGLVYGGGGAARSAVYALYKFIKCSKIYIVNRDEEEVQALKESFLKNGENCEIIHVKDATEASRCEMPLVAVLTVPDFPATTSKEKQARYTLDVFKNSAQGTVLEMCYHPTIRTSLYKDFAESGWNVIDGTVAMMYQGFEQIKLWSGYGIDKLPIQKAKNEIARMINDEVSD